MGGLGNVPNFDAWLEVAWGMGSEFGIVGWGYGPGMIGLAFGTNPPYYLDDFLASNPVFFGQPTTYPGAETTVGTNVVSMPQTAGLAKGQFVQVPGMPSGTIVASVSPTQITVNNNAESSQTNVNLTAYASQMAPVAVIQLYLNLAAASLVKCGGLNGWFDSWEIGMGLFIAHYITLYLESTAAAVSQVMQASIHGEVPAGAVPGTVFTLSSQPPTGVLQGLYKAGALLIPNGADYTLQGLNITLTASTSTPLYATWPTMTMINTQAYSTPVQVAAQGLANGIMVSKSVGDVSASYQVLTSLEAWGAWNLTRYGQLLATMAKGGAGAGPALVW